MHVTVSHLIVSYKKYFKFYHLEIPDGCANYNNKEISIGSKKVSCIRCATGFILENGECISCPVGCTNCVKKESITCTECEPGKEGFDCANRQPCTGSIKGCETFWTTDNTGTCLCKKCWSNYINVDATGVFGSSCVFAQTPVIGCDTGIKEGGVDKCSKCNANHILGKDRLTCVNVSDIINCKTGYLSLDDEDVEGLCKVPETNFMPGAFSTVSPVAIDSDKISDTTCLGYLSLEGIKGENARCAGCPINHVLEFSKKKYNCRNCPPVSALSYCQRVTANNGKCYCANCTMDSASNYYLLKPDQSECIKCNSVTNCAKYTLKLANGAYECTCKICLENKLLSTDGKHCVDCSSIVCTEGKIIVGTGGTCSCECYSGQIKRSDNTGCVSCAAKVISNCHEKHFALSELGICICNKCIGGYVLKADKSTCLSCTTITPGGITPNCHKCTESSKIPGNINSCSMCVDGYALKLETESTTPSCMRCQTGCKSCTIEKSTFPITTAGKCKECYYGYALNSAGNCIQCPQTPSICNECRIDPDDNKKTLCLQWSCSDTGALRDLDFKCETCSIKNCNKCVIEINGKAKCLQCNNSYFKNNDGLCKACIANCNFCTDEKSCIPNGCKEGFIRDRIHGICISCTGSGVARCVYEGTESDNLIPKLCKSGYKLNTITKPIVCEGEYILTIISLNHFFF